MHIHAYVFKYDMKILLYGRISDGNLQEESKQQQKVHSVSPRKS